MEFERPETVSSARLYFYADGKALQIPTSVTLQAWTGSTWKVLPTVRPVANGETAVSFPATRTSKLRAVFDNPTKASVALAELKVYGARTIAAKDRIESLGETGLPVALDGLESENSHTGVLDGVRWRDATNGGFFQFKLPAVTTGKSSLVVTYWGSDVGNRRFDVLVDGVKVGEQTLENEHPGEFFEVDYPLPATIAPEKSPRIVRFQAKPGAIAGGVFGVRIVSR